LGLYPPSLAIRTQSSSTIEQLEAPANEVQQQQLSPLADDPATEESNNKVKVEQALIVDDNAINRRLLSAWMKKHKIAFKEAKDGQQALDLYKEAKGTFDLVLMDISMPVMDGMTSTRLIREHERENEFTPSHIIALTGLTSASAKLEAWTSGVDDYLSKPVDFKRLESLMDAGRGGEGTGFMKEHGSIA
jgi:CheY-like chemotaxis protein